MVGPERFYAQTARTPVYNLARILGLFLDVLGRGIVQRHRARIREHGGRMRRQRQYNEHMENDRVYEAAYSVWRRQNDHEHDHELGVEYEKPGNGRTYEAAYVFYAPYARRYGPWAFAAWAAVFLVVGFVVVIVFVRVVVVIVVFVRVVLVFVGVCKTVDTLVVVVRLFGLLFELALFVQLHAAELVVVISFLFI